MSKPKARRVDFYPDEYIAGVGGVLRADEQGVYWLLCSLIMSEGGAIIQDDRRLSALCRGRPADVKKIIDRLIQAGKIMRQSDGKLSQNRAQSEVEKSLNRIQTASENGSNGGRPRRNNQQKQRSGKAPGSFSEKLTTNQQPPTSNQQPLEEGSKDPPSQSDVDFSIFWQAYPKRADRKMAEKAFTKASKRTSSETIIAGAVAYAAQRSGQDPKYTKNAATWLNNDCWTDAAGATSHDPIYDGVE
ncbi:DUF1376 domain-containing protein [Shinella sp.]|uniref:DUF1376 domain-containing protein n=1 Tax=Shinella sp. TaxID=1870904 RepID=UPI003F718F9C